MNFAEQLKTARKASGHTQQSLSDTPGIPKRTIEDWERGLKSPASYFQTLILEKIQTLSK